MGVTVGAPPGRVWAELERIEDHVTWMADASSIRFLSDRHRGLGTTFECDTRVGPLRLTDLMEITEWEGGRSMGVRHRGVVTGEGRFTLEPGTGGSPDTLLCWEETLRFPWWMGAGLGGALARPVLARLWRGNLHRFARRVEEDRAPERPGGDLPAR